MTINRRQLLASAAGGVSLSPLFGALCGQLQARAAGTDRHPLRFVFFRTSSGLWAEMLQPQGMEHLLPFKLEYDGAGRLVGEDRQGSRKSPTPAADQAIPDDARLSQVMEPLEPFRDRISIVQGINSGFGVYHKGNYQTLGAFAGRRRDGEEIKGPTIDSVLAQAFPAPVPHVCLGHDSQAPSGVAYLPTSARGIDQPMPFYTKPKRAYAELFGVVDDGAARQAYDVQSSILDFFVDDARRLQSTVAGPEREQLDRYLNAFASLRGSRRQVEALGERLRTHAPAPPEEIAAGATEQIAAANAEIAVGCLLSGLTNAVTLQFDELTHTSYRVGSMHAGIGHGQVKSMIQARQTICRLHFEQIARIAAALKSIPEGDGTMLDNTVMVYTSDNGESHHSSGVNFGLLLLGDLGGRLARRRYFSPGNGLQPDRSQPGYTRLGDVWATLLAAAGVPYKEFGLPINNVPHAPLKALLA